MLLPLHGVQTDRQIRQRILRLLKLGVTQKAIASAMNISESTLTRFVWPKKGQPGHSVRGISIDGFERYRLELLNALRPTPATDERREKALDALYETAARAWVEEIEEVAHQLRRLQRARLSDGDRSSGHTPLAPPARANKTPGTPRDD